MGSRAGRRGEEGQARRGRGCALAAPGRGGGGGGTLETTPDCRTLCLNCSFWLTSYRPGLGPSGAGSFPGAF